MNWPGPDATWLGDNSIAIAAVVNAVSTMVLVGVTSRYVALTSKLTSIAQAQHQDSARPILLLRILPRKDGDLVAHLYDFRLELTNGGPGPALNVELTFKGVPDGYRIFDASWATRCHSLWHWEQDATQS